jgi:hypothetical protein
MDQHMAAPHQHHHLHQGQQRPHPDLNLMHPQQQIAEQMVGLTPTHKLK